MTLYVPDAGERTLLEWAIKSTGGDTKLKIFKNDATLAPSMTAASLTEADFTGYTARTLARATWGAAFTNADGKAQCNYGTDQIYNFGSDQTIYGHYWTDASDNLLAVEKYASPRNQLNGDEFIIQPRLTFTTLSGANAVITNLGERTLLDWILRSTPENLVLRLFKTAVTPLATSVLGDFTESDFTGYAAKTLTRASWNAAATVSNIAEAEYSTDQTYSPTSNQDLWGYMLVTAGGDLVAAEKYSSVRAIVNGDDFTLQPRMTLRSES